MPKAMLGELFDREEPVVVLADDLTGAGDAVLPFWHQLGLAQVWPNGLCGDAVCGPAALSVNLALRHAELEALIETARQVNSWVSPEKASIYLKMDSTLRGTWPHWVGCLAQLWQRPVLVAPAFPAAGRTTINAIHYLHGQPVHETIVGLDPLAPVTQSNVRALAQQTGLPVEHVRLAGLRNQGMDAIRSVVVPLLGQAAMVTVDAETDDDVAIVAEAIVAMGAGVVPCGSAGLATALAPHWCAGADYNSGQCQPGKPFSMPALDGNAVQIVSGSETTLTETQWAQWQQVFPNAVGINTAQWPDMAPEAWAEKLTEDAISRMQTLVQHQQPASGWILCGGETASVVLQALGVERLQVVSALQPTMPLYQATSCFYPGHTLWVATKSGNFGAPDTLVSLYQAMLTGKTVAS